MSIAAKTAPEDPIGARPPRDGKKMIDSRSLLIIKS
jgi:hypothetical protein